MQSHYPQNYLVMKDVTEHYGVMGRWIMKHNDIDQTSIKIDASTLWAQYRSPQLDLCNTECILEEAGGIAGEHGMFGPSAGLF